MSGEIFYVALLIRHAFVGYLVLNSHQQGSTGTINRDPAFWLSVTYYVCYVHWLYSDLVYKCQFNLN